MGQSLAFIHSEVALWFKVVKQWIILSKVLNSLAMLGILLAFIGCESSSSVKVTPQEDQLADDSAKVADAEEPVAIEVSEEQQEEAEQKYRLATQLLEFAGPIDDRSLESRNVRWLAADLLQTAIDLNPNHFKYYRDLFMTYMVLQEPVRAFNAIEPATTTPTLAEEVAEFQPLVFGALEFASLIESDSQGQSGL